MALPLVTKRRQLFDPDPPLRLVEPRPPLEPALVRPALVRPRFGTTPDVAYEPKWDGIRCIAFRGEAGVDLQTRRGVMLSSSFPDVAAAFEAQIAPGTVVDGELVVWDGTRLHFGALQSRLADRVWPRPDSRRVPVGYVLFDLLAERGHDLRARPYGERRARLEQLAEGLAPPLFLTQSTTDARRARSWYDTYPPSGIEGLVLKPVSSPYRAGEACWDQVRHRRSVLGVIGGVLGTPARPVAVVVGRPGADGRLRVVGATRPLLDDVQHQLGELLQAPEGIHPWRPDPLPGSWVGRLSTSERVSYLRVAPTVVAEVMIDSAWDPERWRHLGDLVTLHPQLPLADLDQVAPSRLGPVGDEDGAVEPEG